MRVRFFDSAGGRLAVLGVAALLLAVGCQDDKGAGPVSVPDCAISGVNTGLRDNWVSGENVDIRWTQNGVPGTVVIELLKAGIAVATIAPAAPNTGFYPWQAATMGQDSGSDFGFRVTGTGEAACMAEVTGLTIMDVVGCGFTFGPLPDEINAGQDLSITWVGSHTAGSVDIELWTAAFGDLLDKRVGIIALGEPDDGSYSWTADSFNFGTFDAYRIVIRDTRVTGCEVVSPRFRMVDTDICTTVVGGPNNIPLNPGAELAIQLDQVGGSGFVDLRLFTGNEFVRGGVIADNVSVVSDTVWTVTDFGHVGDNTRYNIRAIDVQDPYCIGRSDDFTITR